MSDNIYIEFCSDPTNEKILMIKFFHENCQLKKFVWEFDENSQKIFYKLLCEDMSVIGIEKFEKIDEMAEFVKTTINNIIINTFSTKLNLTLKQIYNMFNVQSTNFDIDVINRSIRSFDLLEFTKSIGFLCKNGFYRGYYLFDGIKVNSINLYDLYILFCYCFQTKLT